MGFNKEMISQNNDFYIFFNEKLILDDTYKKIISAKEFNLTKNCVYLCGHSLGLMPKKSAELANEEFKKWANLAVKAHFLPFKPWVDYHSYTKILLANLTGATEQEVVAMGSLTSNIHTLLAQFYKPTPSKYKIVIDVPIFSSDYHAVTSWVELHGLHVSNAIVEWKANNEYYLELSELESLLKRHNDEIALLWLSGVNYLTGQVLPIREITALAKKYNVLVGLDLAHATGNVPLMLHDWEVDFAAWCSYKYLNSGPGGVAGIFIHQKHLNKKPTLRGWWGHSPDSRFTIDKDFVPANGVDAWQLSNAPIVPLAIHEAALRIFEQAGGIDTLRKKSLALTQYLLEGINLIIKHYPYVGIKIITPVVEDERGSMICISTPYATEIFEFLDKHSIVIDYRKPDILRITPTALYNTFSDVATCIEQIATWCQVKALQD